MRTVRHIALLLIVAAVPATAAALLHPKAPPWRQPPVVLQPGEVSVETAKQWGGDVIWIDARASAAAFAQGHVPGAIRLNESEWDALLPDVLRRWEPGRPVVVYCDSAACNASHGVARQLREQVGIDNVHVLHGGWAAWEAAGGPAAKAGER